jgi:hypothetical protein
MPKELLEGYHVQPKEVTERIKEEIKKQRQEKARQAAEANRLASAKEGLTSPLGSQRQTSLGIGIGNGLGNGTKTPMGGPGSGKDVHKGKSAGLVRRKKAEADNIVSKCTLLGIGNLSYKDILQSKDDRFDPASLVLDDGDARSRDILRKFEYRTNDPGKAKMEGAKPDQRAAGNLSPRRESTLSIKKNEGSRLASMYRFVP